jgi:hypothetical protein
VCARRQIQLVEFDAGANEVAVRRSFKHAGEVWHLAPSPHDAALLVTCAKPRGQPQEATVWRMPVGNSDEDEPTTEADLEEVCAIPTQKATVSKYVPMHYGI